MTIVYTAKPITAISAELLRDLNSEGKAFAVIRTSPTREQVWSFHTSQKTAEAACRRWRSRDIVTR